MPPRSVVHGEKSPYETENEYKARRKLEMAAKGAGRDSKSLNFEPKRVRKAKRKALLRGVVGNTVASVRSEFDDRAEFYRNLRMIKMRRKHVAKQMRWLGELLGELLREVQHVEDRYPDFQSGALDEAQDLAKAAYVSVSVAADEFTMFARARVYYVKEL